MPAKFSVVQYVPDPVADERINIGVIAFNESEVRARFVRKWDRARRFGQRGVGFLRDFAQRVEEAASDQMLLDIRGARALNEAEIRRIADRWKNSIQLTVPRGSVKDVDALLDDAARIYLREGTFESRSRGKRQAAVLAATEVERAIAARFDRAAAHRLIERGYELAGKYRERELDVAVRYDRVYLGMQGLSFELQDSDEIGRHLDVAARAMSDLRSVYPSMPLAVATLPPNRDLESFGAATKYYSEAKREFADMHVFLLSENELALWAQDQTAELPAELASSLAPPLPIPEQRREEPSLFVGMTHPGH